MKAKTKKIVSVIFVLLAAATGAVLFVSGAIKINTPSEEKYPVRGVDVSEYQGRIDWKAIEQQGMQFAFIKATEGSSYTDPFFSANWQAVDSTAIIAGAYHFFSFDSPGKTQAENFITAVEPIAGMLPPAVDIELYGEHKTKPPAAGEVRAELDMMLDLLTAYYGVQPIIYATQRSYALYINGYYPDNPLWIRDVYFTPSSNQEWTFWQYTDKGKLDGYHGEEKYIDINVFAGTAAGLKELTI
jgi:Lyzozyme M1 (1,4-beta-N-acetylmuramidase)